MDEPARKRRKTASPDPRERESSPLKKPPRRPSFASPTKASLARNYPNLVQRPASSGSAAARPTSRSGLLARGKQGRSFVPGEEDEEEPELPSTPSQRQLAEKDTPRRGILFSSPSKRPPRIKNPIKQTPLKSKAPAVQEVEAETPEEEENAEDELSQDIGQKKKISPPDPELEKRKQEKAQLQHEIEKLEAQVSRCAEEIAKDQEAQVLTSQERDDLIHFISTITNADIEEEQSPSVSNLLCSFLPFSTRIAPPPKTTREEPIPSHQPIELDNPSPYLEMFTTFKYTTRLSLPRKKFNPASSRIVQKHTVDIAGPQKLLSASLSVTIDAEANKILDLQILRLSSWAERELGKFTRERAQEKDLGNVCWAIGSYWEIARKRAEYWHKCEQTFAQLIPGHSNEDIENLQNSLKIKPSVSNISRKDLNRHLGRDLFILQDKHVLLKLVWHIDFDWTGEAGSSIHVEPAFPQVWSEADTSNSFAKVPATFSSLLQSRGAFEATRTLVALLFSGS